jgi:hypothetical protein
MLDLAHERKCKIRFPAPAMIAAAGVFLEFAHTAFRMCDMRLFVEVTSHVN